MSLQEVSSYDIPVSDNDLKKAEEVRKSHGFKVDMDDRDPCDLNSHVKTSFPEVIGEPDGCHSDSDVWFLANKAFYVGRTCCFTCLAYVCAIPLAFVWGCNFACITFAHIYSITPCLRVLWINCDCASKFFGALVHCLCDPCYEALALMFGRIYINLKQNTDSSEESAHYKLKIFATEDRKPPHGIKTMRQKTGQMQQISTIEGENEIYDNA